MTTRAITVLLMLFPMLTSGQTNPHRDYQTGSVLDPVKFDPSRGSVLAVVRGRVLWSARTMVESTKLHRARTYLVQYYLQTLDHLDDAHLVYEQRVTSRPRMGTVLTDGSILLWLEKRIWATPGQVPVIEDTLFQNRSARGLALYPDGAVVRHDESSGKRSELFPLWWIPIKDKELDFPSKLRLSTEDGGTRSSHLEFIRHGDRIAWLDAQWSKGEDEAKRSPLLLHIFDVGQRQVTTVELHGRPMHYSHRLHGFDGKHALGIPGLIDVETGQVSDSPSLMWDKPEGVVTYHIVGMLDGVIYVARASADGYELRAVPVAEPQNAKVIHRWDAKEIPRDNPGTGLPKAFMQDLFFLDGDDVRAWNGQTWIRVAK